MRSVALDARSLTPINTTLLYLIVGGCWVAFSDQVVVTVIDDPALVSRIQTGKGWLFVAASAGLIYVLVSRRERRLVDANERLQRAIQQTTVLHRILRHNLRNVCNVIEGNVELLEDDTADHDAECIRRINEEIAELIEISEKTKHLRALLQDDLGPSPVDAAPLIEALADDVRRSHPNVDVRVDLPDSVPVSAVDQLEFAFEELAENAVKHHDCADPTLWLSAEHRPDGTVRIDAADDGPGVPEMERAVLEQGFERPTFHSEGLGLWLVWTVVENSGGSLRIVDNEPRGSVVRLTLPAVEE